LRQLIKVFGIAARLDVQIGIVAGSGNAVDGRVFLLLLHFLEAVEDLTSNQITLFDPAFLPTGSTYFRKTLFPIENIDAVTVFGGAYLLVNLRQLVAQNYLRSGYVINLKHPVTATIATAKQGRASEGHDQTFAGEFHG
jgi:hypothetical protein